MKPKLKKRNLFEINHEAAIDFLSADKFINYMSITNSYEQKQLCAVYYSSNPDLSKGHKPYPMLTSTNNKLFVLGRDLKDLKKDSIHTGVLCLECNTVLVSLYRHDFHGCGCFNETFVDGGQEAGYRTLAKDFSKVRFVKVDMLNNRYKVVE